MSNNHQLPLSVQPIISYTREAQVGKTYLMTIDLQTSGDDWPYEDEEYPIYCMLETSLLFSSKPVGEPAVVLHRFGGTYGAAQFLLIAPQEEMEGEIRVTLVNRWAVPVRVFNLNDITVNRNSKTRLFKQLPVELVAAKVKYDVSLPFPSGPVSLDSPFYIERSPIEKQVYAEIGKPGALVLIKAPQEMGKTSLLLRVLEYAKSLGYRTVNLNLQQVDQAILSDLNRFLRWLCANIACQLDLEPILDDYWDEDIGIKISCTLYLRKYLLEPMDSPLVLALDEVNQIFEHPKVAKDFFSLLRSWYEEAKRPPVWQKLRLIVVNSKEIYVPRRLLYSHEAYNVGLTIQLNSFSLEEVLELAKRYGLNWISEEEAKLLIEMVGGHPALVHIAIYHLSRGDVTIAQLLQIAPTSTGIYSSHLQRHQATLQEQQELASAFGTVMNATKPVPLEPILAYRLSSMGLIKLIYVKATLSCDLYPLYFKQILHTLSQNKH